MKLWRGAGNFTQISGTDRTIHFEGIPPHLISGTTELYEFVLLRRLRRALEERTLSGLTSTGGSIYLLIGAVLAELLGYAESSRRTLYLLNAFFGPALEGLKLLEQGRRTGPVGRPHLDQLRSTRRFTVCRWHWHA